MLVIFSCIFWHIRVLQGLSNGNVTRSTNVNLSSLTNGNILTMTDANLTKLFVHGCTRVIQKNHLRWRAAQILLRTISLGLLGKLSVYIWVFYLNICDQVLHKSLSAHFPLASWGAVGLHMGVLTKPFVMSVLFLKTIDICFKRKSFDKSVH